MERYKILLVDDERSEREGIAFLIQRYGYPLQVRQASNGQRALELMQEEKFNILFTDIKMPVMDGLTLVQEVAKAYPETISVIFSSHCEFDFAQKAMEAGVAGYLPKPIELREFQSCMERVMQKVRKKHADWEQNRVQRELVREALLYRLFHSGIVSGGEKQILREIFFGQNQEGCIPVLFTFADDYFAHSAESFYRMAEVYFPKLNFVKMLPNEAWLVIRHTQNRDALPLKERLKKLLRALQNRKECLMIVGEMVTSLEELTPQLEAIEEMRREIFGYGDRILFAGDSREGKMRYARDIEVIKGDIFTAVEGVEAEKIRDGCTRLCTLLTDSGMLSRIYISHLLYSIVRRLYEKMPRPEDEDTLIMAEEIFSEKRPEKVLSNFLEAVDRMLSSAKGEEETESQLIVRIKRFMQTDYRRELSLVDVADCVGLSPAYVSYMFKKETGQGVVEYVTGLKMKKAQQLLEDRKLKIVQVARACGYENQSYFNRLFKSHYGITPGQYREGLGNPMWK